MSSRLEFQARSAGTTTTHSTAFEVLTRIGFIARGVIYAIIGGLAIQVATHATPKTPTNQKGALETIDKQPLGHWLLIVVAAGLGAYALWRFVQAYVGHGPEGGGDDSAFGRISAAASGVAYLAMCALAISILAGASSQSSSSPHKSTAGVLGWPGGQWIVGIAGVIFVGVALYQGYKGVSRKFLEEDKTAEMGPLVKRWITISGVIGHLARMVAFGLIGVFLIKAAVDYAPNKAVGLDGALEKLARESYGTFLLAVVAAGLIAFGLFSIAEARYRRI
ncbi:MAG TPA: DUF1206 domain-containing protein [Gaiellales bacterium]|jgi:hypothetical protein|nr:DUF1206 domain-containing protein [Gaiellales bacterium]